MKNLKLVLCGVMFLPSASWAAALSEQAGSADKVRGAPGTVLAQATTTPDRGAEAYDQGAETTRCDCEASRDSQAGRDCAETHDHRVEAIC